MPRQKRGKTRYAGVTFITGIGADGSPERIYYITYRKDGRLIEEKAGRAVRDGMTAARAAGIRADRIDGKALSNRETREQAVAEAKAAANRVTVADLWRMYSENGEAAKSLVFERSRYRRYLEPAFGKKEPREILPLDVDRLRLRDLKGKAPQTVKQTLGLLVRLCNYGKKKLGIPGFSFEVEFPRVNNEKTETLTEAQIAKLLEAIRTSPDVQIASLMYLALLTGMRKGELLKLKWADVDFEGGFILLRDPKGGHDASIPMNATARTLLENHPRIGGHVFSNDRGECFHDVRKRINKIRKAADLPSDFRGCHGLRHAFASALVSNGATLFEVQRLLNQKSPLVTKRYAHIADKAAREASCLMDKVLAGLPA